MDLKGAWKNFLSPAIIAVIDRNYIIFISASTASIY